MKTGGSLLVRLATSTEVKHASYRGASSSYPRGARTRHSSRRSADKLLRRNVEMGPIAEVTNQLELIAIAMFDVGYVAKGLIRVPR